MLALLFLGAGALGVGPDAARGALAIEVDDAGRLRVADELLVSWRPGGRERALAAAAARGGEVLGEIPALRLARVRFPGGPPAASARPALAADADVARAEWNGVGTAGAVAVTFDPAFPQQWHLRNTVTNAGTEGADIDGPGAWQITTGSPGIVLAVLDSGLPSNHPEFVTRTLAGWDFVDEDGDPSPADSHGVLVAGLAAANAGNGVGVAGVDHHCSLLPVRVLDGSHHGTTFDLAQALVFCAAHGADVVSMSLINYPPSDALEDGLEFARAAGCILIACAGNGGPGDADESFPGASRRTISVGATTATDRRAGFSGTGAALDFVAPGAGVVTVSPLGPGSTVFSGCSGATPIVAGIVTLLLSRDPTMSQSEVRTWLREGARDRVGSPEEDLLGRDDAFGFGRVDAYRTLAAAEPCLPPRQCTCLPAVTNSSGWPARIELEGPAVAGGVLTLRAVHLPLDRKGYFMMGDGDAQLLPATSLSQLCIAGGRLVRLVPPLLDSGPGGSFSLLVDTAAVPGLGAVVAGQTWGFQAWFRDVNPTPGSNLTNALFTPFE